MFSSPPRRPRGLPFPAATASLPSPPFQRERRAASRYSRARTWGSGTCLGVHGTSSRAGWTPLSRRRPKARLREVLEVFPQHRNLVDAAGLPLARGGFSPARLQRAAASDTGVVGPFASLVRGRKADRVRPPGLLDLHGAGKRWWLAVCGARVRPDWSSTGALAFTQSPEVIGLLDQSGLVRRLTATGVDPSWAPAGDRLAFTGAYDAASGGFALWSINADGTGLRKLWEGRTGVEPMSPTWSPDGRWIAFIRSNNGYGQSVWVVRPSGRGLRMLMPAFPDCRSCFKGLGFGSIAWQPLR